MVKLLRPVSNWMWLELTRFRYRKVCVLVGEHLHVSGAVKLAIDTFDTLK